MEFPHLLRNARVTTFQSKVLPIGTRSRKVPVLQVLKTTPASFHRKDWGVKANLPAKAKDVHISLEALDSAVGILPYEPASGFYRKLQRFREFGVHLQMPRYSEVDNLLKASPRSSTTWSTMSKEDKMRLYQRARSRRHEFHEYMKTSLSSAKELYSTSANLTKHIEKFMGIQPVISHLSMDSSAEANVSSAGLSYALKGSLYNTPRGIQEYKRVPGRVLNGRGAKVAAGLGGFVSNVTISHAMNMAQSASSLRAEAVYEFIVQRAQATQMGHIELQSIASKLFERPVGTASPTRDEIVDSFMEAERAQGHR